MEENIPIKFYGMGITKGVTGNNLTLFRGNKQDVLVIKLKWFKSGFKVFNFSNECHKPTVLKFFGFTTGTILPNNEYQNMY